MGNRLNSIMLAGFATVALLAAIGIDGVISYAVVQRTHETGLVFGLLGTLGLTRLLSTLLFGVSSHDPMAIAAVGAILAVVAVAWRATCPHGVQPRSIP